MVSTQSDDDFLSRLLVSFFPLLLSFLYRFLSAMFLSNLLLSVVVYLTLILSEVRQKANEVIGYSSLKRSFSYQLRNQILIDSQKNGTIRIPFCTLMSLSKLKKFNLQMPCHAFPNHAPRLESARSLEG